MEDRVNMVGDRQQSLKWHRCEAKYLISERQAQQVSHYCRDYLPPDCNAGVEAGCEYPILSVYLDSRSRTLLRNTLDKHDNRYKLRVRTDRHFYTQPADLPRFFEIKRKMGQVVHKTRTKLAADDGDSILWADREIALADRGYDEYTQSAVNEFAYLRGQIAAQPVLGVFYTREAYEGISAERTRITLDRNLHYGLLDRPESGGREMWWPVNPGGVILEIKFTNVYPFWVSDMLRRLEISRCGVCKYVICSQGAGISWR